MVPTAVKPKRIILDIYRERSQVDAIGYIAS
jgi:hypothetical protein